MRITAPVSRDTKVYPRNDPRLRAKGRFYGKLMERREKLLAQEEPLTIFQEEYLDFLEMVLTANR